MPISKAEGTQSGSFRGAEDQGMSLLGAWSWIPALLEAAQCFSNTAWAVHDVAARKEKDRNREIYEGLSMPPEELVKEKS